METLPAEVTIRPYAIDPNDFLDALNVCEPTVVERIMDAARAGDIVYREGFIYWLASQAPPLPVRFIASHDPR
jgi:hypothetical protein